MFFQLADCSLHLTTLTQQKAIPIAVYSSHKSIFSLVESGTYTSSLQCVCAGASFGRYVVDQTKCAGGIVFVKDGSTLRRIRLYFVAIVDC